MLKNKYDQRQVADPMEERITIREVLLQMINESQKYYILGFKLTRKEEQPFGVHEKQI